jgi:hypothetical protein
VVGMNNERSLSEEITEGFKALEAMRNNEPVAWMSNGKEFYVQKNYCPDFIPLYTHPAKTLTDEEIVDAWNEDWIGLGKNEKFIKFARAILRKAQEK